jgi:hypothetical protein
MKEYRDVFRPPSESAKRSGVPSAGSGEREGSIKFLAAVILRK